MWQQVEDHPLSARPRTELEGLLRAGRRIERVERDVADLSRRVDGGGRHRGPPLPTACVELLGRWGYLDGWRLTRRGQLLARCYHECDLLVVEALARGLLDGLDPAALAALVSLLLLRAPLPHAAPAVWMPSPPPGTRYRELQELRPGSTDEEERARLALTREPDATFAGLAYAWASGGELDDVLADEEVSGGDFVRNVKQLIDLCRQLGDLAPEPDTAAAARQAADLLYRGVVAASSIIEVDAEIDDPEVDRGPDDPEVDAEIDVEIDVGMELDEPEVDAEIDDEAVVPVATAARTERARRRA